MFNYLQLCIVMDISNVHKYYNYPARGKIYTNDGGFPRIVKIHTSAGKKWKEKIVTPHTLTAYLLFPLRYTFIYLYNNPLLMYDL